MKEIIRVMIKNSLVQIIYYEDIIVIVLKIIFLLDLHITC